MMNYFIKTILPCIILSSISACTQQPNTISQNDQKNLSWIEQEDSTAANYIDTVEYILLEAHPDGLFREIDKLIVKNDKIFIFDFIGRNQVLVFDRNGKFLYKTGNRGRGPKEYIQLRNFTVDDKFIYLIDNIKHELLLHDIQNGNFITKKTLPFVVYDMAVFDNGNYIFSWAVVDGAILSPGQQPYRIYITDSDMNIKNSIFPTNENDCSVLSRFSYLTHSKGYFVFNTLVSDSIAVFDRKAPDSVKVYHIDFKNRKAPLEAKNDPERLSGFHYLSETPIMTPKYMIGQFNEDKYGGQPFIYDLNRQTAVGTNIIKDTSRFLQKPLAYFDNQIFSLYDYSTYIFQMKNGLCTLPDSVKKHMDEGDGVLITYHLK
jgi:hypothetical protein